MTLLNDIKSRGYWDVTIRPLPYEQRIHDMAHMLPILQRVAVQIRGWDFPHIDDRTDVLRDAEWIGQDFSWADYLEIWRLYLSGQFVDLAAMVEDWNERSLWPDQSWPKVPILGVGNTLFRFTEIFELATRLSVTEAGAERVGIRVTLFGLEGRKLWSDALRDRRVYDDLTCRLGQFTVERTVTREELAASGWELAVLAAADVFRRFGWDDGLEILREQQEELHDITRRLRGPSSTTGASTTDPHERPGG